MTFHRRLISLVSTARFQMGVVLTTSITGGILIIFQAWLLAEIINLVHLNSANLEQVTPILFNLALVFIIRSVFMFLNEHNSVWVAEKIKFHLRNDLAEKILRLGPAYIEQQKNGELAYILTRAVDTLEVYFSQYLPQVVMAAILPLGILLVVFPLDFLSSIIFILTAPLIPVFMVLIGRTTETLTNRQFSAFSRMSAFFLDTLRGLAELKNLGRSRVHAERLGAVNNRYREATMRVLRVSFLSALVLELAATLSVAVIAVEIGIRLLYGQIAFQQAFFLLVIAPEFYQPLRQLGARFHSAQNGVSAARKIFQILDQPEEILPNSTDLTYSFIDSYYKNSFVIRFEDVSFSYPNRHQDALHQVTFTIHSGETIAIMGLNGSGKTTLVSLLLRFIQPREGRIIFNGIDIQTIPIETWRAGISWLNQHPVLFNDSIRNNLLLTPNPNRQIEIHDAIRAASLEGTIQQLPEGLETQLGENAARLSAGQAQRVGLARAFLKDKPFLILDEPTTHLDLLLESELNQSLAELRKNRTCLMIAHRRETARQADRVLFLKDGRLAGQGTHSQLLAECKNYLELFGGKS